MALNIENYEKGGRQKKFYEESEVVFTSCPLCGASQYEEIYKERGSLGVVKCLQCDLIYANPRLKEPEQIYFGDTDKYFEEARLIFEGKAKHHRDTNYFIDLKLISKYKPSGNLLDIGTNMGFFLRNARDRGWNLYGIEPSPSLSEMARKYFGLNIKTGYLEEAGFNSNFFDVITLIDVFEHITQPAKMLTEVRRILKPSGILFIKVPNGLFNLFKFYTAKLTRRLKYYDVFDSYEHVVHYSEKTLRNMLKKFDFRIIKTYIGRPIQIPAWHKYVGYYYQYPSPWCLDPKDRFLRMLFYILSLMEFRLKANRVGYLAPNIIAIAKKIS